MDDGKESSFDKQIRCELEEKMILNGNSQLFLCLQDLAATADIKNPAGESFSTSFAHQLEDKMRKVKYLYHSIFIFMSFSHVFRVYYMCSCITWVLSDKPCTNLNLFKALSKLSCFSILIFFWWHLFIFQFFQRLSVSFLKFLLFIKILQKFLVRS